MIVLYDRIGLGYIPPGPRYQVRGAVFLAANKADSTVHFHCVVG